MATNTFATLVRLMPLDGSVPEPAGLSAELRSRKEREKRFLDQLLHSQSADKYCLDVKVSADLRSYQVPR